MPAIEVYGTSLHLPMVLIFFRTDNASAKADGPQKLSVERGFNAVTRDPGRFAPPALPRWAGDGPLRFRRPAQLLQCRITGSNALDHNGLDLTGSAAPECRGSIIFRRGEAGDALLEGRKLNHNKALEFIGAFHDLKLAPAGQHLAAEFGENAGNLVGVFFVFDRVVDLGTGNPISRHV